MKGKVNIKNENTKSFGFFEILLAVALVFVMLASVGCYINKYEINYDKEKYLAELEEAKNEGELLKFEYQRKADYNAVRDYAENTLGMKKIEDFQIIYMPDSQTDSMQVVSNNEGLTSRLSKTFSIVLEYFK